MNQNSNLLSDFLWSRTKPNLSNWIVVLSGRFFSSGSPFPLIVVPSGMRMFVLMLSAFAGSHCKNLGRFACWWSVASLVGSGFSEMNEKVRGFSLSMLSDLKLRRCMSR